MGAFGAVRKMMVEFHVPWNDIELFATFVCHAFLRKTAIRYRWGRDHTY